MARVLRSRPSFNESTSDHSPNGARDLNNSRSGKRYRTPDGMGAGNASSSSHLISRDSPLADSQYTDDEEAIYVRSKYSPPDTSVTSPRKRRRTEQSSDRGSGSPTPGSINFESSAIASSTREIPVDDSKHSSKIVSQLDKDEPDLDQKTSSGFQRSHPGEEASVADALTPGVKAGQPKDQAQANKAINSTAGSLELEPKQPDSDVEYDEEDEDAGDLEAFDDDAAGDDEDGEGDLEDQDDEQDDAIDDNAVGDTFSVVSDMDGASTVASVAEEPLDELGEPAVPSDPNELTENDLPPPFLERSSPPLESTVADPASYILATKFLPLSSAQQFVAALTKHAPANRSMETLYRLAQNTQEALLAWQDEFLMLDKRTAPIGNPPKKPATGGREPLDPSKFEAAKEADLYSGYTSLRTHGAGHNEPGAGRGLRRRRRMGGLDSWNVSEDDAGTSINGKGKRARRPVRRFDEGLAEMSQAESTTTSKRRRGGGGGDSDTIGERTRKRGRVSTLARSDDFASSAGDMSDDGGTYGTRRRGGGGGRGGGNAGAGAKRRKQRVKSEKRSESMTLWWAERKRKAAEQKIRELRKQGLLESKDGMSNAGSLVPPQA